jgi:hypothetical protein
MNLENRLNHLLFLFMLTIDVHNLRSHCEPMLTNYVN